MKKITHKKERGFVLMYVVIVLTAFLVVFSFKISQTSLFSGSRIKINALASEVRTISQYCAETLLMDIKDTPSLIGSGTLTYNAGTCAYTISGSIPNKIITITASKSDVFKKISITITQTNPRIQAVWQEIP